MLKYLSIDIHICHPPNAMQIWCDFLFCSPGTIIHIMNVVYLELYWYGITFNLKKRYKCEIWARYFSRYRDWLRAGWSWDWITDSRFSAPVQTGPGAHPASCRMGTRSFLGVKYGRGVMLTPHPLLVPWSWKSRAIPLPILWAVMGLLYFFFFIFFYK
jgi:hypothetical protein